MRWADVRGDLGTRRVPAPPAVQTQGTAIKEGVKVV
jgi:hypothetical protein